MYTSIDTSLVASNPRCYTLNTQCSKNLIKKIHEIQDGFISHFGNAVFCPREEDLHATLLDWINPFIEYKVSPQELFMINGESWKQKTNAILSQYTPISVQFSKLDYRGAGICLQGFDQGEFEVIRKDLQNSLLLPKENKQPPRDIHVTIITFREALNEDQVLHLLNKYHIEMCELISFFRLVYSPQARSQNHKELLRFYLNDMDSI